LKWNTRCGVVQFQGQKSVCANCADLSNFYFA
jgi:ribosomal protein L37E